MEAELSFKTWWVYRNVQVKIIVLNVLYYCQNLKNMYLLILLYFSPFPTPPPPSVAFSGFSCWITSEDNTASCNKRITHSAVFRHRYIQIILMLLSLHRQFCCDGQAAVLPTYDLKWNFACKTLPWQRLKHSNTVSALHIPICFY